MTDIHKREPVVLIGIVASLLVLVAGKIGVVLDHATVQGVLEPVVVSLLARQFVSPAVHKTVDQAEDLAEKHYHD